MSNVKKSPKGSSSKGFSYVKSSGGIKEFCLNKNGLKVLIKEDHSLPVATVMVTYHVGSRNEAVGHTGSTHILEHMMFKKTKNYPANYTDIFTNEGGRENATTWMDRTNYFEILPIDMLSKALAYEADRMRNLAFTEEDLKKEMVVVRNEYERGENSSEEALDKAIWASAFQAHPYHHSTIGWLSDIENVTASRLYDFYNTYYWPNNATLTVIGDVSTNKLLELIKKSFGRISASPKSIPQMLVKEPAQEGVRKVVVSRSEEAGIVGIAQKVPNGLHQDIYPLAILAGILVSGKSSRLYKKLVETNLATKVSVMGFPFRDPSLFTIYSKLSGKSGHEVILDSIINEIKYIKDNGVNKDEIKNAITKNIAQAVFARDGSYNTASNINEAIATGDWTLFTNFVHQISSVTAEDVIRVAKLYFNERERTIGFFIPK
ncbi:MAG: pitrilysin family protein [bacterium]|nr:pitrilysin family protein [bacterium]